jgi:hypothetical protein
MMLSIVVCMAGLYLGLSYRIAILIPVTIGTGVLCSWAAYIDGQSASAMTISIVIPTISLQCGYMLGLTSRDVLGQFLVALANFSRKEFR